MGKRSIKENKNIYQLTRESLDLTRDQASELMGYISADRIEKIENERSAAHPDEILTMSRCYKTPSLCNYYCTHECSIGREYVPEIQMKDLSQIVLEVLSSLNALTKAQNRLIDITVDGEISEDEYKDFSIIQEDLNRIALSVSTLKYWVDQTIAEGKIDKDLLEQALSQNK